MKKILIIDDNIDFVLTLKDLLESKGYKVDYFLDTEDIEDYIVLNKYDLILLDVMLKSVTGFNFLKVIREEVIRPVIFLSAKNTKSDILKGLKIGGDDYITKPFDNDLLLAKINSHLRRESYNRKEVIQFKDIRIHRNSLEVKVKEKVLNFSKSEFDIIWLLANNLDKTFTKEEIFNSIYGIDSYSEIRVVVQYIYQIRVKFREYHIDPIENIWGVGYKWNYQ
ncbi:MAG: response regulator transcription factor [Tissierella sp.]|uniref:response regulator transcription factor n=1 Tax=Tissierella sp. TaxID=41274 RepID=UPI003F9C6DE3